MVAMSKLGRFEQTRQLGVDELLAEIEAEERDHCAVCDYRDRCPYAWAGKHIRRICPVLRNNGGGNDGQQN